MSDLRAAWVQLVKHLRAEAEWRAGREVDVLDSYRYLEQLRQGFAPGCFNLEANLSYSIATLDEFEMPANFEFGDVFEHVETMLRLGDQALEQIERQLEQGASTGGSDKASPTPLGHAKEGGSEFSLQVARVFPNELRRFGAESGRPEASPVPPSQNSEKVCFSALEQNMTGSRLRSRDPSEPGGSHDVDLFQSDSDAPPVRVEFTELTSEMGEQWGKGPRSGKPRAVKQANGQLKYLWHASVNMTDTLFQPEWGNLVKDNKARKKRGVEIDEILLKHLQWTERQMGTIEGAVSLANQRISAELKPGGRLLVFPFFKAEKAPSSYRGGLTVSYDGYSVDLSTIGSCKAAEPINRVIAAKAKKNQAGALSGEKWLVVYLDPVYAIAVALSIEAFLKRPTSWLAVESKIDRHHFEEVWLVWDQRQAEDLADFGHRPNVVRFTPRDSHFAVCA